MMEGSGSGSVLVTNESVCGSRRPRNIRIRIHNNGNKERNFENTKFFVGILKATEEKNTLRIRSQIQNSD
jgi:hypothetical protein